MIRDLILANRSYRRFEEQREIPESTLRELVDLGRISASAANLQPLKYVLSNTPDKNKQVFSTLEWAGYLKGWDGPAEGERPAAYITILLDTKISKSTIDHGIAAQSILLGAAEKRIGGCMIGSIDREKLNAILNIPAGKEILLVLALGYPKEKVVLEEVSAKGSIEYYRDSQDVHRVPKRRLIDVII